MDKESAGEPQTEVNPGPDSMTGQEMERIASAIYGRWGWQTKLAMRLGKNGSTLRRWLAADSVPASEAMAIRAIQAGEGMREPERTGETRSGDIGRQVLVAMALAATLKSGQAPLTWLKNSSTGLEVTFGFPNGQLYCLREVEGYAGLDDLMADIAARTQA